MSKSLRFTDKNFQEEVLDNNLPVFVDFWASWCPPCKAVEPIMNDLAEQFEGVVKVGKLNIDQNAGIRAAFNISAAPTFILFRNGQVLQRVIGAHAKKQLVELIQSALNLQKSEPQEPKRSK